MNQKLFFTKEDFNALADLKGQLIELHIPISAEADYEFGLRPQQATKKIEVKTILNDQRERFSVDGGQVSSGSLSAQFVDPNIPDPLPKNSWFVHRNIRYRAEEQPSITIEGKRVVRTVALFQDPTTVSGYKTT